MYIIYRPLSYPFRSLFKPTFTTMKPWKASMTRRPLRASLSFQSIHAGLTPLSRQTVPSIPALGTLLPLGARVTWVATLTLVPRPT